MNTRAAGLVCVAFLATAFTAHAQAPTLIDTLRGAQEISSFGDVYGDHVTADDNWLIVSAPREDVDLNNDGQIDPALGELDTGAVYIYRRGAAGFILHQRLTGEGNNTVASGDRFGAGVTLQGNWLFVGSSNDNSFPGFIDPNPDPTFGEFYFAGQVSVFRFDAATDQWLGPVQKLVSDVPESGMSFGARTDASHVAAFAFGQSSDASILLVGEPSNLGVSPAKLHVFKRTNNQWARIHIAMSPSGSQGSFFADAVIRAGKLALVSESRFDPMLDTRQVHAYRITRNGILNVGGMRLPVQTLNAPGGGTVPEDCLNRGFGAGMAGGGGVVAIADPCDSTAGPMAGAVHVYTMRDGDRAPLRLLQSLLNPNPGTTPFYGANFANGKQSVETDGQRIVVGTTDFQGGDRNVDIYLRGNASFALESSVPTPEPGDPVAGTLYGQSVNLLGNGLLGISQMGYSGQGGGRVFVYEVP